MSAWEISVVSQYEISQRSAETPWEQALLNSRIALRAREFSEEAWTNSHCPIPPPRPLFFRTLFPYSRPALLE